jgi:3-oxoacyl-[acyl-carrier protein] reductase
MTQTIVVTGAGRGLGLAITRQLLEDGYSVISVSRTETDDLKKMVEQNDALSFIQFDLAETDKIDTLCRQIIKQCTANGTSTLYGLVNNAAIGNDGVLGTMHKSDIKAVMDINVLAAILMTKYLSRAIMASGTKGRIVNIGSIIGSTGYSGLSVYGASKAAMEGFTRSLARELGRMGITVNVVAPGYMETDMTNDLQGSKLDSVRRRSAMRLFARPEDVAGTVAHLISPQGARITGTVVTVDAGSTA